MSFDFKNIQDEFFSPGDIFWKKSSGNLLLVSKKGDFLNHAFIQKLLDGEQELIMENGIDFHLHRKMRTIYEKYSEKFLMRDKINWRERLIESLMVEFVGTNKSQFELNFLSWKFFSKFTNEEAKTYMERDNELFNRNLSIASSYTVCAFLLGYYDAGFLSRLFCTTFEGFMNLGKDMQVLGLKETLESLRRKESLGTEDHDQVREMADTTFISSTVIFERYDGSGMRKLNCREMSDLDIVLVALVREFGFEKDENINLLERITEGNFPCEEKILRMLQRILHKKENATEQLAG